MILTQIVELCAVIHTLYRIFGGSDLEIFIDCALSCGNMIKLGLLANGLRLQKQYQVFQELLLNRRNNALGTFETLVAYGGTMEFESYIDKA